MEIIVLILLLGGFALDLVTPRGYSDWVFYVLAIVLAMRVFSKSKILMVASTASVFMVLGFILSPPGWQLWASAYSRSLGLMLVWTAVWVALRWRRGEDALRESEERFRQMADNIHEVFYMIDVEHQQLLYVSPASQSIWGRDIEKSPLSWFESLHPDDRERVLALREQGLKNRAVMNSEYRIVRPDGEVRWIWDRAYPVATPDARMHRLVGVAQDITEHRRAEEALVKLQKAVDASGEVVFMTDREGVITFVNPEFTRVFGYTSAEVVGKATPRILKSEKMAVEFYAGFWNQLLRKEVVRADFINKTKDNRLVNMEVSVNPILDDRREISGFLAIQRDVTARKKLEEQFRQSQKMEAIGQLAGGVAHDFNNLLTVINGYSALLQEEPQPVDDQKAFLKEIQHAGERASDLTRQLLAFSRKQVTQPVILDLNAAVQSSQKMLERVVGENIRIVPRLSETLGHIRADAGQIEQVMLNLAVNARDAMPKGGTLTIETASVNLDEPVARAHPYVVAGNYVLLAVSDTGCGMDAETQSHIFEPFFTTKGQGKGTGLGLSTVYGIMKQSGGHINVYSEVGRGTTFKVYFKQVDEPVVQEQDGAAVAPSRSGTETVLLVEDEPSVRTFAQEVLKGKGFTVLTASSAEEALLLSRRDPVEIQLLLTDVIMPGMNGKELADRLRLSRPAVKVLFISGYTGEAISQHGILDEGVSFLSKPFSPRELLAKVRQTLDRPRI